MGCRGLAAVSSSSRTNVFAVSVLSRFCLVVLCFKATQCLAFPRHILGKREGRRGTARWWDKTGQTTSQTEAGILRSACMHGSQSPQQQYDLYPSLLFLSDPVPSLSQR